MKYYYSSRLRKGLEYYLSNKSVLNLVVESIGADATHCYQSFETVEGTARPYQ